MEIRKKNPAKQPKSNANSGIVCEVQLYMIHAVHAPCSHFTQKICVAESVC